MIDDDDLEDEDDLQKAVAKQLLHGTLNLKKEVR